MVRRVLPNILLILLLSASTAFAQPALPDIAASIDKDGVLVTWTSQYNAVKAISVLRSQDSVNNFEIIGYVKRTEPGIQSFIDLHPPAGKNYYKLAIIFNKGLTWRSNHIGVFVAHAEHEAKQPIETTPARPIEKPLQPAAELESSFRDRNQTKILPDTCRKSGNVQSHMTVSISADSGSPLPIPRPRVHMSFDEPAENMPIFIRSRYIHTDTATGHVDMFLPEDVTIHHYSIKFYDKDKHMIVEVPKINSPKIIIDKRNFQRKGVYKFALRKDFLEIESGYIVVDP